MNKDVSQIIAEQDAEIARLKNLLNRAAGYMSHTPLCVFVTDEKGHCDCNFMEVYSAVVDAIKRKGGE